MLQHIDTQVLREKVKTQVLVLHNEQKFLDLLSNGLSDKYKVHCASSGMDALDTLSSTPIHIMICAQDMPGMSGLDVLREAKKQSPDTTGILLAPADSSDDLDKHAETLGIYKIIRGNIGVEDLKKLMSSARQQVQTAAIAEPADVIDAHAAAPAIENIVMETADDGEAIVNAGTRVRLPTGLDQVQATPIARRGDTDILVLSTDEEFVTTIKHSSQELHKLYRTKQLNGAEDIIRHRNIGVLVMDAALVGPNIAKMTERLRSAAPRLVTIVAGRRADGESLMDLASRGHVYRFLLKPVSAGRARLAIEASVRHHLDAEETAFNYKPQTTAHAAVKSTPAKARVQERAPARMPAPSKTPKVAQVRRQATIGRAAKETRQTMEQSQESVGSLAQKMFAQESAALDGAFDETGNFTETMTNIAKVVGKSLSKAQSKIAAKAVVIADSSREAMSRNSGLLSKSRMLKITAWFAIFAIGAVWVMNDGRIPGMGSADPNAEAGATTPRAEESFEFLETVSMAIEFVASLLPKDDPPAEDPLEMARAARDAGKIVSPPGDNALEYYADARMASPRNQEIVAELEDIIEDAYALAEVALMDNRSTKAARILKALGKADPESRRLRYLTVQVKAQQLKIMQERERIGRQASRRAIADRTPANAGSFAAANSYEFNVLSEELAAARDEYQRHADNRSLTGSASNPMTPVEIEEMNRIYYVAPEYPRAALRRGNSGWVYLEFTVTIAGEVADIEVIASDPKSVFDTAAISAVDQWRFDPVTEGGRPIAQRVVVRLTFGMK